VSRHEPPRLGPGARRGPAISRRRFLAGAATVGAAGAAGYALARGPLAALGSRPSLDPSRATLVVCTLYGGNDGLNTVVPYQDPAYHAGRGELALSPTEVLPLGDGLGLHPRLAGLKRLWDAGELAIVRGVGYPDPSFSHFRSMDIWQSAVPDTEVSSGWIGRWLDATRADPLSALSLGPTLPLAFRGERVQAAALPAGSLSLPGTPAQRAAYAALERPLPGQAPLAAAVAASGAELLRVQATLSELLGPAGEAASDSALEGPGPKTRVQGPGRSGPAGQLGQQLDAVARLIAKDAPTKVYGVSLGGFDTHTDEKATQARLLSELDAALSGFVSSVRSSRRGAQTVVLVYSEFGRRVAANASGGTDHGSAAPVLVLGPPVRGGFYGEEPSLTDLDSGNLKHTVDFRSVYATLLAKVVGVDPGASLEGRWPHLDVV